MQILKNLINKFSWWETNYKKVLRATVATKTSPANVALESYNFWLTKTDNKNAVYALLGNEEGETSFILGAVGDKSSGGAHGIFQWHQARIDLMKIGCAIDITTATHADQLKAAYWEMTQGSYKKVWPKLVAATNITDAITVLVSDYERSGSQARDIARRSAYAQVWQQKLEATAVVADTNQKA